ncbi:MAG: ABC transporter substrate-binding protein [Peptococcaceae bacterium]
MKQKVWFKYCSAAAVAMLAVGLLSGCGNQAETEEQYKIGIVQLTSHEAANTANQGFVQALADHGLAEGESVTFVQRNGQNEQSNLESIAQTFINEEVDLICAVSTSTAQVMASATEEIPIVGTAITDYVEAKLVESNEVPAYNVTGTSDQNPVEKQGELILQLVPDAKTVGVIYNSSEINSQLQVAWLEQYLQQQGIVLEKGAFSNISDMQQAAANLVDQVDAIYLPTDNTVASGVPQVIAITEAAKLPVICGEVGQVEGGGTATYGIDYYKLGYKTGEMAVRILKDGADPAEMPIEYADEEDLTLVINQGEAERIGLSIPQELLEQAQIVETKTN